MQEKNYRTQYRMKRERKYKIEDMNYGKYRENLIFTLVKFQKKIKRNINMALFFFSWILGTWYSSQHFYLKYEYHLCIYL